MGKALGGLYLSSALFPKRWHEMSVSFSGEKAFCFYSGGMMLSQSGNPTVAGLRNLVLPLVS